MFNAAGRGESPAFSGKGGNIVSEPAKSNAPPVGRGASPTAAAIAGWCETGLDLSLFLLPPILALVPHGAAPLAGAAGLCAAGLLAARPRSGFAALWMPAALLGALLLWGALSAVWSITPLRSLVLEARLVGLFAAALALMAAASRIAAPQRLAACLLAGTAVAIAMALSDLASSGGLSRLVSERTFGAPRLNAISAWLAMLCLPAAAMLARRGRIVAALLVAAAMAATVYALEGVAAKIALALSLPVAALFYWRPRRLARLFATLSIAAILTAPVTLPYLANVPGLFARVDAFKDSAGHRLLIWSFTGAHIAERPLLGWGLDTARAIPGGKVEIRRGQTWLPLHPHNAALQIWLELGAPGALLFATIVALVWLRLGAASWPRLYTAAAAGSAAAALAVADASWGIWQEWWLGTLAMALVAIIVMARAVENPA